LATPAENPFVRSPLRIASKRERGEFPASSETLWTLVGTTDPHQEETVVEDPRESPTDPEATVETAKKELSTSEDKNDS